MREAAGEESEPRPRVSKRVSKKSTRNTMLSQSVHVSRGRGILKSSFELPLPDFSQPVADDPEAIKDREAKKRLWLYTIDQIE